MVQLESGFSLGANMQIDPDILALWQDPRNDLNEKHLAQYMLYLRLSHNGTKDFAVSSELIGKRMGVGRSATKKRRRALERFGLIAIVGRKGNHAIYRIPQRT